MSKRDEDVLPTAYKYAWFPESELPLQNFLAKVIIAKRNGAPILTYFATSPVQTIHGSK
jgi:hypothetical protein